MNRRLPRLQHLLSSCTITAPLMRFLAYMKNDVLGERIEDQIIKKMISGWQNMTILDIGCGPCRKQTDRRFRNTDFTCFDIFKPYLATCQQLGFKTVIGDAREIDKFFKPRSYDIVWLIDVIEHLQKKDGFKLLHHIEKIAKKQILVSTPLGWYPLDHECVDDNWGEDIDLDISKQNKYQQHISAWYPNDLEKLGYTCEVLQNFHPDIRNVSRELINKTEPVPASQIWAIKLY